MNQGGHPIERRHSRAEIAILLALFAVLGVVVVASIRLRPSDAFDQLSGDVVASGSASATTSGTASGLTSDADTTWQASATTPFGDGGRWESLALSGVSGTDHVTVEVGTPESTRTWRGVGAALTDSSVALLAGRGTALDALFDPSVPGGAGLDIVRLPLSGTDFSTRWWTWEPADGGAVPPPETMAAVDVLRDILDRRPDLTVTGAAWTAPPTMRTAPTEPGGALVDVDGYGRLLAAKVATLRGLGVPLVSISLGNEPGVVTDAPSMTMTDAQMIELSRVLAPELDAAGVELLALDHNWSDVDRAARLAAEGEFDAVAFHCYGGDSSSMAAVTDLPTLITECTATTGAWHSSVGWMARELVGDAVRAGSTGLVMWNLALDPSNGPKRAGGCETCRGLLTVDPVSGSFTTSAEYSVLVHLSAAADPGAQVLDVDAVDGLPLAVFRNPDGSLGIFGHNDRPEPISVTFRIDGARTISVDVPSWAIFSLRS